MQCERSETNHMPRPRHANIDIEKAIQLAEKQLWTFKKGGESARSWGSLACSVSDGRCSIAIWSTPKDPSLHAKQITSKVRACAKKHALQQRGND